MTLRLAIAQAIAERQGLRLARLDERHRLRPVPPVDKTKLYLAALLIAALYALAVALIAAPLAGA